MEPPRRQSKLEDHDLFAPPPPPPPVEEPEAVEPKPDPIPPSEPIDQVPPGPTNQDDDGPAADTKDEKEIHEEKVKRPRRRRGAPPPPITRNARRRNARGPVSDDDLISFNCKMTRGLRRAVKHYAADFDVDIQDIVAAALEDYLADRGVPFPGSDQVQPD
ncbi:hypothetical protein [Amycolatopsis sp. NPDC059657]|uniref:hypothetical protein n=1 Tax=Amycolatopsis sp. NPDC059657 TaxID=3346899 RepID=UPI003672BF65